MTKYLIRIIALPFVVAVIFIGLLNQLIRLSCLFLKNGGEFISYVEKDTTRTIADIFSKLVEMDRSESN